MERSISKGRITVKQGQMTANRAQKLASDGIGRLRDGEVSVLRSTDFGIGPSGYWVASNGATVASLSKEQATEAIVKSLTGK